MLVNDVRPKRPNEKLAANAAKAKNYTQLFAFDDYRDLSYNFPSLSAYTFYLYKSFAYIH